MEILKYEYLKLVPKSCTSYSCVLAETRSRDMDHDTGGYDLTYSDILL